MASWEDIENRESLEAWLGGQPREVAIAIAARAALRVMPIWAAFGETDAARDRELTPLPFLRSGLISAVAAVYPTSEIRDAARAAASTPISAIVAVNAATVAVAEAIATVTVVEDTAAVPRAADAARRAAEAADDTTAAIAAGATVWEAIQRDAEIVEGGEDCLIRPLWPDRNPLQNLWERPSAQWSEPGSPYDFWRRWYESLLFQPAFPPVPFGKQQLYGKSWTFGGPPIPQNIFYRIALIPNDTWDAGPEAVAEAIREIEAGFDTGEDDIANGLATMSPSAPKRIQATKRAMERHRADLPPTFDAILGYISLEVKRLQERNYRDADDEDEAKRQIRTLTTLYRAVEHLQSLIPESDEMPIEDAEKAEKLARLYLNTFKDWPREHVDDVVGGVYAMSGEIAGNTVRMGLVAATAFALPMIGVPTPWALGAGIAVFGNKTIAEAAKSVRDSVFPNPS